MCTPHLVCVQLSVKEHLNATKIKHPPGGGPPQVHPPLLNLSFSACNNMALSAPAWLGVSSSGLRRVWSGSHNLNLHLAVQDMCLIPELLWAVVGRLVVEIVPWLILDSEVRDQSSSCVSSLNTRLSAALGVSKKSARDSHMSGGHNRPRLEPSEFQ